MTFGEKLTDYLRTNKLTDSDFGKLLAHVCDGKQVQPVSGATIWGWRHDRSEPPRKYRKRIIAVTGGHFGAEDFI